MNSQNTPICIYCGNDGSPCTGEGDHIVPAALGEFKGIKNYYGICVPCNNLIGKFEEEICRSGPESLLLRMSTPPGRRTSTSHTWIKSKSAPSPKFFTPHQGIELELKHRTRDHQSIELPDQIILTEQESNKTHRIIIYPGMNNDAIKRKIENLNIEGKYNAQINVEDKDGNRLETITSELWPEHKLGDVETIPYGYRAILIKTNFIVSDKYFSAIQKIALHFYLTYNTNGYIGSEKAFDYSRGIILNKFDHENHIRPLPPCYLDSTEALTRGFWGDYSSSKWCHTLTYDDTGNEILVYITLFCGQIQLNTSRTLICTLGQKNSRLPGNRIFTCFLYWTPKQTSKGKCVTINTPPNSHPLSFW